MGLGIPAPLAYTLVGLFLKELMTNELLFAKACLALQDLGLSAGDFCRLTLAQDIKALHTETGPISLEDTIDALCGDGVAYDAMSKEIASAWELL